MIEWVKLIPVSLPLLNGENSCRIEWVKTDQASSSQLANTQKINE